MYLVQFLTPYALLDRYLQLFLPFLPRQTKRRILGCVSSNNFESPPDRSSFVIRCDYPVQEYKESGRIKVVVSYLFCQA